MWGLGHWPPCSWKSTCNFRLPQNPDYSPSYRRGSACRTPADTKICRRSSPLHEMVENNACGQPSTFTDSHLWIENTVLHSQLVESMDVKLQVKGQLYMYWKKSIYQWTCAVQTSVVQRPTAVHYFYLTKLSHCLASFSSPKNPEAKFTTSVWQMRTWCSRGWLTWQRANQ